MALLPDITELKDPFLDSYITCLKNDHFKIKIALAFRLTYLLRLYPII